MTTHNLSAAAQQAPGMYTTAGDWEREKRSRRWNLLEALGVMTFLLIVLWPFGYGAGVLQDSGSIQPISTCLLAAGAIYLLFVAPFLHGDTAESWGLGNPRTLWRMLTTGSPARRVALALVMLALFLALNYANYSQWREVVDFFNFHKLAESAGLEVNVFELPHSFPGVLIVFAFGSFLSAIIVIGAIRYDNFLPAFATALKVALPLLFIMVLAAILHRGWEETWEELEPKQWAIGVLGYVFWGFVQQLLFSSYFGTRFRKGFAPSKSPRDVLTGDRRILAVLGCGAAASIGFVALSAIGIRHVHGPGSFPAEMGAAMALFFFPLGAVYGFFLSRGIKRLLVATLAASCFGMIHIASYKLVAVCWILGIVLIYVFMEAKNRNLVALGFIHGLLGSTFGSLFSHEKSGALEVDYSVGPWNIDNPTASSLIIPMLCIGVFVALMVWAAMRVRD